MAGYYENSRAREERIRNRGGLRDDDNVDLSGGDDKVDLSGGDTPLSRKNAQEDWNEAVRLLTADRDEEERQRKNKEIEGELAGFDKLVNDANAAREQHFHNLDVAALAMFRNAARSPYGASDPALNGACGKAFGIPGFSGIRLINKGEEAGSFAVMQAVKGQNGQIVPRTVMLLGPDTINGISQRLRRNGYTNADVTAMSNYAWNAKKMKTGWTDDQLVKAGFSNPNGPVLMGQTENGKAMSALAGRTGDRHSRISVFASDGKGGATRQFYDGHTGEFYEENIGNRAPDAKGRWKVMSVGPSDTFNGGSDKSQVRVYENSKTGERVRVKDGETPPWQKSAMSDKERIAQINKESRLMEGEQAIERAKISADATKYKADKGLEGKKVSAHKTRDEEKVGSERKQLTKDQIAAMKGMLELAYASGMSEEEIKSLNSKIQKRISEDGVETGGESGGETSGDGGAKGKVKYTDLKPGQKFTMTDKDGKKRRCVKTEKGYKFID